MLQGICVVICTTFDEKTREFAEKAHPPEQTNEEYQ